MMAVLDKLRAILLRDLRSAVRYRGGFAIGAASTVIELAAFYFMARAIGPAFRPDGMDYFSYLLVGTGFYTLLLTGVTAFLSAVQEAQQTGTLEVLLTTATPPATLVFLSACSSFAGKVLAFVAYLGLGALFFGASLSGANIPAVALVLVLSLAIAVALGILTAALQIATQRGSAVIWLLGSAWFLTGTMFPVTALPAPLQYIARLIPITYSLEAMRAVLVGSATLSRLTGLIMALLIFAAVLLPLSVATLNWVVRRARLQGTLSFY
jgi:ABC-2 type transport system permease protein